MARYEGTISFISKVTDERVSRTFATDNPKEFINWYNKYGAGTYKHGFQMDHMSDAVKTDFRFTKKRI
ncbi:MAG: hypothetical protein JSV32_06470 [Dehalococcoidia bacterium]|nr:MAG: hypothetical protein JSV32_06470 [Dehalococcoidia bacterium]